MTILHGAAARPGRSRSYSPRPGALAGAPEALIARHLAPPSCSRKPARQDRPMTARPRMTVFTCVRSGGQPKGARCLP
jgi:hypothetical protein